jgi:hypothetical protein
MGHPVIAVREIVATDACGMMVDSGFIAKHNLGHDCTNAIAALLGKTLDWDLVPLLRRFEHPSR